MDLLPQKLLTKSWLLQKKKSIKKVMQHINFLQSSIQKVQSKNFPTFANK